MSTRSGVDFTINASIDVSKMNSNLLEPCRYCGNSPVAVEDEDGDWLVFCVTDGCGRHDSENKAIGRWNDSNRKVTTARHHRFISAMAALRQKPYTVEEILALATQTHGFSNNHSTRRLLATIAEAWKRNQ